MFRLIFLSAIMLIAFPPIALAEQATFTVAGETFTFEIADEVPQGYDRDDWPHWDEHVGGDCFTVRDKVLAEESFTPVRTVPASNGRCRVVEGLWHGPYTGLSFTDSGDVDIDHVVPLKEAHRSGGHSWDRERRRAYANHLNYAHHLIAVEKSTNRNVKSDRDPDGYLPQAASYRCEYVEIWIRIKHAWNLNMDQDEIDAINEVLAGC